MSFHNSVFLTDKIIATKPALIKLVMTNSVYVFLIPVSRYIEVRLTDKNVIYTS